MDDRQRFQQQLQEGALAGNINISDHSRARLIYGRAAEDAIKEKEEIERLLEQQKIKSTIHIPTNDNEVKTRLRILKEPICYFGEDAAARRSRLHNIIADKMTKGEKLPEFRRENEEINMQINDLLLKMQESHKKIDKQSSESKTTEILKPTKIVKIDKTGAHVTISQTYENNEPNNNNINDNNNNNNDNATTKDDKTNIKKKKKLKKSKKVKKLKNKKSDSANAPSINDSNNIVNTGHTFRKQEGTEDGLISNARREILHFSMSNAAKRVNRQRERRENPLPPQKIAQRRNNIVSKLQKYNCQLSVISSQTKRVRPLTIIRISPPLLPPSHSSKERGKNEEYPCTNSNDDSETRDNEKDNEIDIDMMSKDNQIIKREPNDFSNEKNETIDISYDRYLIAIGSKGGEISIWNEDGQCRNRWQAHSDHITGLSWQPYNFMLDTSKNTRNCGLLQEDLRFLTSSIDRTIGLWDANGTLYHRFDTKANANLNRGNMYHSDRLNRVSWHPMGKHFISTSHDRSWMFWDICKQRPLYIQKGHSAGVYSVDCQCDGSLVATGDMGGIIRLWDLRTGRCIMSFDQHIEGVLDLSFSFNGYIFASASQDHSCQIWDLRKKEFYTIAAHNHSLTCVQFCFPNICQSNIELIDRHFDNDKNENNNNNNEKKKVSIYDNDWFDGSYDSEWLITAGMDRCVKVWSANQSNYPLCNQFTGHEAQIAYADVSFDGNFIVSCSYDKTWKLWATDDYIFENDTKLSKKNIKQSQALKFKKELFNENNNDNVACYINASSQQSTLVTNVDTQEPFVPFNITDAPPRSNGKMEIDDD